MFQNRGMMDEWTTFETPQPSDPLVSDNRQRSHDRSCAFCLVCEVRHCLGFVLLLTCFPLSALLFAHSHGLFFDHAELESRISFVTLCLFNSSHRIH